MYPEEIVIYKNEFAVGEENQKLIKLDKNIEFSIERTYEENKETKQLQPKIEAGASATLIVSYFHFHHAI